MVTYDLGIPHVSNYYWPSFVSEQRPPQEVSQTVNSAIPPFQVSNSYTIALVTLQLIVAQGM